MSPVHSVQTMSDDEIKKNFARAQDHVRDVHSISSDHEDFDKSLNMHPFFKDVVAEYKKRGLDKPPNLSVPNPDDSEPPKPEASNEKKPLTFTEPDLQHECKLTPEEIEEGKKNLASTEVPEGAGSAVPEPVGQTTSTMILEELTEGMTSSEVHQEEETPKEEGLEIQMGTENLGPGDTKQE